MNELLRRLGALEPWMITALRVVLIAVAAYILIRVMRRAIRVIHERVARRVDDTEAVKRAETLSRVFRYFVVVAVSLVAGMLILTELGVSVAPVLGAAGVVGIAVGFGAQSLVKDFFSGFFILLENQIRAGDVVEVAGKSGLVEEITLRYVRLRDYEGNVHYVPNGLITTVSNMSRSFAHAVIDVGVAYREDIDQAFAVMREVAAEMRADPTFGPKILDELEIAGVERWADSAVILRLALQGGAARAVERAPRVSAPTEEGVRSARHRNPLSASHGLSRARRQGRPPPAFPSPSAPGPSATKPA